MATLENAGLQLWMKHSPFLGHSDKGTRKVLVVYIIIFFFTGWLKLSVAFMKEFELLDFLLIKYANYLV
jgi:hypothetical protein